MEPLMAMKILASREDVDQLQHELRSRGARLQETELRQGSAILRAKAGLPVLLAFKKAVASVGLGDAQVFAWPARRATEGK